MADLQNSIMRPIDNRPKPSRYELMKFFGYKNSTKCYDDFNCDTADKAALLHKTFGSLCFLFCLLGLFANPVCLPAFNLLDNRSGATFYLTLVAISDLCYVFLVMIIFVVQYMPATFDEQMEIYGTFTSKLIPSCLPLLSYFELLVVWLILALLMDRLLYMKLGFQSKTMFSRSLSIKISSTMAVLLVVYTIPKYLGFYLDTNHDLGLSRVMFTDIGTNENYKNMVNYWLKVPIEMFLPYLGVTVFNAMLVAKMINLRSSKWRAVINLCYNCCQEDIKYDGRPQQQRLQKSRKRFTNCLPSSSRGDQISCDSHQNSHEIILAPDPKGTPSLVKLTRPINANSASLTSHLLIIQQPPRSSSAVEKINTHNMVSAVSMLDLQTLHAEVAPTFLVDYAALPAPSIAHHFTNSDETRENANVMIAVIIGFTLLVVKIPKFILHILSMEDYLVYDQRSYQVTNYFLDVLFAAIKPVICFSVGAHFRSALIVACGCAKPRNSNTSHAQLQQKSTGRRTHPRMLHKPSSYRSGSVPDTRKAGQDEETNPLNRQSSMVEQQWIQEILDAQQHLKEQEHSTLV